jgi:hypothetical protein
MTTGVFPSYWKNPIYVSTKSEQSKKERKIQYVGNEENRRKIPYKENE